MTKSFIYLLLLIIAGTTFASSSWVPIAPGIEYQDLGHRPWSHIHVFRVSPKKNTFSSVFATTFSEKLLTVDGFAKKADALIAINGGFFDNQSRPLGLRISDYKKLNPLKPISWWGVFYIQDKKPRMSSFRDFNSNERMEFAIQAGPRLLIDGSLVSLKPGIAERTALGITKNRQVLIVATENAAMSTRDLALLLKSAPLHCTDALNLDGGSSTQLAVNTPGLGKKVWGFTGVSDAVVIKAR